MTDEQINIAIAESLGWKVRWQNQGGAPTLENKPAGHCWAVWTNPNGWGLDSNYDPIFPPNYTSDLNACHELEKMLDDKQLARYAQQIIGSARRKMNIPDHESHYPVPFIISATARQRCEAYLRTLGKWIE